MTSLLKDSATADPGGARAVTSSGLDAATDFGGSASTNAGERHSMRYVTEPMRGPNSGEPCRPISTRPAWRSRATLASSSAGSPYATSASRWTRRGTVAISSLRPSSATARRSASIARQVQSRREPALQRLDDVNQDHRHAQRLGESVRDLRLVQRCRRQIHRHDNPADQPPGVLQTYGTRIERRRHEHRAGSSRAAHAPSSNQRTVCACRSGRAC